MLAVDRDLSRVFDIDDATKVKLAGDRVTEIGKGLERYDAVSAGLFVMAPSLVDALDGLAAALAHRGGGRGGRARDWSSRTTSAPSSGRTSTAPEMRLHAEWLLRVYGDELARPTMQAAAPSAPARPGRWRSSSGCSPRRTSPATCSSARGR